MNFELNLATIFVALLVYLLTVFIKPFILILRDNVVWQR